MKRYFLSAAVGGVLGLGFGLVVEGIFWLSISDDIFSWTLPKFTGLFFAFLGALEPLRHRENT